MVKDEEGKVFRTGEINELNDDNILQNALANS